MKQSFRPRVVARLDVKGPSVIKGIQLDGLRVVGDLSQMAKSYSDSGVDEILIMDAVASLYRSEHLLSAIKEAAESAFIPITVGGGIRSVDDAKRLFGIGVDRVAINSKAIEDPKILSDIAEVFGDQAVVLSVEAKSVGPDVWHCFYESGREDAEISVVEWISQASNFGVGEVLLTSVDCDGVLRGPDLKLVSDVSKGSPVRIVYSGGIRDAKDILNCFEHPAISGVAIGSALHYGRIRASDLKSELFGTSNSNGEVSH